LKIIPLLDTAIYNDVYSPLRQNTPGNKYKKANTKKYTQYASKKRDKN